MPVAATTTSTTTATTATRTAADARHPVRSESPPPVAASPLPGPLPRRPHTNRPASMRTSAALAFLVACLATASAVDFLTCDKPQGKHSKSNDITVSACTPNGKLCRLKKRTDVNLEIKFSPDEDIDKLTNTVHANLLGVPFPFIGVDGTSACESVFNADGSKAGCPLKKGQQYIYKNSFKIHDIYPKVRLDVHWALTYGNKKAVCFEVPARIVS